MTNMSGFPAAVSKIFNKLLNSHKECHFSISRGPYWIPGTVLIITDHSSVFIMGLFRKRLHFFKLSGSNYFISLVSSSCLKCSLFIKSALGIHTNGILARPGVTVFPIRQIKCKN